MQRRHVCGVDPQTALEEGLGLVQLAPSLMHQPAEVHEVTAQRGDLSGLAHAVLGLGQVVLVQLQLGAQKPNAHLSV